MLSIENPPPDPSCHHEKPSDNQFPQLDLIKSNPKFSIRDYVSSTRRKDIETNWPFSRENLQLCLKHGVKDLLPPFQSLDAVRNPSAKRCGVENAEKLNEELSSQTNHLVSVTSSDAKPVSDSVNIDRSGIAEDREIPSSASSETNYKKELEAGTSRKPEKKVSVASKVENTVKLQGKKCRLILKLNSTADQSSKEDNKSNNLLSETMASKVCPVCKTFTSSSNTTLNAHIDQCLSGESTIKWTANPKVIKNKIKPRRMKLMVDIYAVAAHYTLEDLDRRNGTNWAAGSSLPAQEIEADAAERKQKSPVSCEESENEGAVYVDANGTKLRILSKFNDLSSSDNVGEHFGPRRLTKGDKGSTLLLTKKNKKHHKLQKIAPHSKKFCYPKHHHISEMNDGPEHSVASDEVGEKEEALTQQCKAHDPVKCNESGTMGGWVSSKRTGLMMKMNDKDDHRESYTKKKEYGGEVNKGFSLQKSDLKSGYVFRSKNCSKNLSSSPKTNMNSSSDPHDEYENELFMRKRARVSPSSPKTNINSSSEPHDEYENEHYVRKKAKKSLMEPRACYDQSSSLVLSEANQKKLSKNGSSAHGTNKDHLHNKTNPGSSPIIQRVEMKRALTTKTKKFSLKKNQVSVPVPESKFSLKKKKLTLHKPRIRWVSESDEKAMVLQNGVNEKNESVENLSQVKAHMEKGKKCDNVSVDRTRVLKVIKGPKSALEYHEHDDDDDRFESSVGNILTGAAYGNESPVKEVQLYGNNMFVEPASDLRAMEASGDISKSSDVQCASKQFVEIYNDPFLGTQDSRCLVEPILSSEREIMYTNPDGENINLPDVHMRTELDSDDRVGNYYVEVDPIPIPGPPGSFLPSPGRMAEEFHGNSSQTSSQIQSSEDHHPELAYRDSSDSPSATSTISNSNVTKFDSRFFEKMNLVPHRVHDEIRSSVSGASNDAGVDNITPDPRAAYAGAERLNPPIEPKAANTVFSETGLLRFTNDQPCCCSRKEGAVLAAVGLNLHESPHLRRQTISSDQQYPSDKQMNSGDASRKLENYNLISEGFSNGDRSGGIHNSNGYPLLQIPNKASAISEGKFIFNGEGDPASPSVSTPVLRLMGKDLMVVMKKDENMSPQLRTSQSPVMKGHGNPQSYTASGAYSYNILKEEALSSHHMVSQGHIYSQSRGNNNASSTQHFDVMLSNDYNNGNFGPQRSPLMLSGRSVHESCPPQNLDYCYFPPEQLRAMNRFSRPPPACDNNEKAATTKEIIIIDDAPERATDLTTDPILLGVGTIRGSESLTGKSVSVTSSGFDPRAADPFYGSPLAQSPNFHQLPPSAGVNSSNINWNCVPKVSNLLPKSPFPGSSSPGNHMRSTLYHSQGGFS